jgi:hypothetical protein
MMHCLGRISMDSRQEHEADASTVKADSTATAPNTLESVRGSLLNKLLVDACMYWQAKHGIWRAAAML